MSYELALKTAGAEVHKFKNFGSYQGDWWAYVTFKGKTGWVHGSYGSCSGCDAFEAEFSYDTHAHPDKDYYDPMSDGFNKKCLACKSVEKKLAGFGEKYLDELLSQEEAVKQASENIDWDMDAKEMVDFVKEKP